MNRWIVIAVVTLLVLVGMGGAYLMRGSQTKVLDVVAPTAVDKVSPTMVASPSAEDSEDSGLPPVSGDVVDEGEEIIE